MSVGGSATTIHLVRHASHDLVGRVLTGRMPGVVLGERGRDEARQVASRLAREPVAAIYTSPMERARETADAIAAESGVAVEIAPSLDEIDCGEWTGRSFAELADDARWPDWNRERADGCPPGGEPMRAVQARAVAALDTWREAHPDRTVVAVSHCDVIKSVLCHALGLSLDRYDHFDVEPASVSTLVLWQGGGKVVRLNETVRP